MGQLRVGIIGAGFGAKVHAPLLQWHPSYDVVSICSVNRKDTDQLKKETGIKKIYTEWEKMLTREELNLVVIASIPSLHCDMAVKAFSMGMNVLCEKPLAMHQSETLEMITAANKYSKFGFTNFEWRFMPARLKVKEILIQNTIGEILHIDYDINFTGYNYLASSKAGWGGQRKHFGGMLGALGSHMVDSLLWWTVDNVRHLIAQLTTHVPEFVDEDGNKEYRDADDAFFVNGQLIGGSTFKLQLVSAAHHATGSVVKIVGTKGSIFLKDDKLLQLGIGDKPLEEVALPVITVPKELGILPSKYYPAFKPLLDSMYETIVLGKEFPNTPTFGDGHKVQMVLDAIRRSSDENRRVYFNE
jgi:predicted dehydrogenase